MLVRPGYYIGGSFYAPAAKMYGLGFGQSMTLNMGITKVKAFGTGIDYIESKTRP